ncbi:MAG: hypothetical protein ACE5K4_10420 [Candidatus Hydrothermarchaeota archaeon]
MSNCSLLSMYTVKKGAAKLTAKLQEPENMIRFLKLTSLNGWRINLINLSLALGRLIRGSGMLEMK